MLIKCPECGKEISNKSDKCIFCGYPINNQFKSIVNGKELDLSFLLDESYSILFKVRDLIQITGSSILYVKPLVEQIIDTKEIPRVINLPLDKQDSNDIPHCPTCNSTNIEKIGTLERGTSIAMWGLFSKKINKSFKCKNCGHTW